jgi:alanine-synthesizing transaminase
MPEPFRSMGSMKASILRMEELEVAVSAGIGFGEEGEGYLRIVLVKMSI